MLIFVIAGALLFLMGFAVHILKWHFLISGYNTMSQERKENVDVKGLARLMGMFLYIDGAVFILIGVLNSFGINVSLMYAFGFLMISVVVMIVLAQKYDHNTEKTKFGFKMGSGKKTIWTSAFTAVILIGVAILLFWVSRPIQVNYDVEGLTIKGMYGGTYAWENIEKPELLQALPSLKTRTNGSAIGNHLRGHFLTNDIGNVVLFVDKSIPPFIYFETDGKKIIVNLDTANATKLLYEEIINTH